MRDVFVCHFLLFLTFYFAVHPFSRPHSGVMSADLHVGLGELSTFRLDDCRCTIYDVSDLVVGATRWVILLGRPFDPNGFVDLVVTVPKMCHLIFSFSTFQCWAFFGIL